MLEARKDRCSRVHGHNDWRFEPWCMNGVCAIAKAQTCNNVHCHASVRPVEVCAALIGGQILEDGAKLTDLGDISASDLREWLASVPFPRQDL